MGLKKGSRRVPEPEHESQHTQKCGTLGTSGGTQERDESLEGLQAPTTWPPGHCDLISRPLCSCHNGTQHSPPSSGAAPAAHYLHLDAPPRDPLTPHHSSFKSVHNVMLSVCPSQKAPLTVKFLPPNMFPSELLSPSLLQNSYHHPACCIPHISHFPCSIRT